MLNLSAKQKLCELLLLKKGYPICNIMGKKRLGLTAGILVEGINNDNQNNIHSSNTSQC